MKYSILLLSLFIICFPGKILGDEVVNLSEPVNAVISKSYTSVCRLKGVFHEVEESIDSSAKVAGNINTKTADHKSKPSKILKPMCQDDKKLRSSVETVIKKACDKTAPQSEIVQKIIDRTCSDLVPRVLKSWWAEKDVNINNYAE